MEICSLVVNARPERVAEVVSGLEALPGVEVHGGQAEGKLIVTVEDAPEVAAADTVHKVQDIEGVINAVLIYHYGEGDSEEEGNRESYST